MCNALKSRGICHGVQVLAVSGRKIDVDWNEATVIMRYESRSFAERCMAHSDGCYFMRVHCDHTVLKDEVDFVFGTKNSGY